ncbi:MAG: sulfite exporter TauE/SafE family protein [Bacteroidota bacterium]|nr:sulfite exporter TauE/SafE family protein [Bacteroidota bacterium]
MSSLLSNRQAKWNYLWKLMPWMVVGILIGVWFGKDLPVDQFSKGMAILIFICVCLMWFMDKFKTFRIPDNSGLAAVMGTTSGFATMVGNLAGPFSELYFLTLRMPK